MKLLACFVLSILSRYVLPEETTIVPSHGIHESQGKLPDPREEYAAIDLRCYEVEGEEVCDFWNPEDKVLPLQDEPLDLSTNRHQGQHNDVQYYEYQHADVIPSEDSIINLNERSYSDDYGEKHKGQESLLCGNYDVGTKCKANSNRHQSKHKNEKSFLCHICGKTLSTRQSLSRHANTHLDTRVFSCKVCHTSFKTNIALSAHTKTHTDPFAYSCWLCGKKFETRSNLAAHVRNYHPNKKGYSCFLCDETFRFKYDLSKHLRKHTNEKIFKCPICHKGFSTKYTLLFHIESHEKKPFSCELCKRKFAQDAELQLHVKMDCRKTLPFVCLICGNRYRTRDNVKRHCRRKHSDNPVRIEADSTSAELDREKVLIDFVEYQGAQQPTNESEEPERETVIKNLREIQEIQLQREKSKKFEESRDALGMLPCFSGSQNGNE
ncbi:hypothetical protein QAD02_001174 [Eretmocerus hayati]|uniref:Uncharacterized protein n=1 Tax=Eretmocerus hayati TaxID=131215 RepID=A0ACC2NK24_9HYME|nr:hypothetical protein QAD02_001174 [Eretmocerus hayati]